MIADSFSRMVLLPSSGSSDACTLPDIVFGHTIGSRISAAWLGSTHTPLLYYQPVSSLVVNSAATVEVDDDIHSQTSPLGVAMGRHLADVTSRVEVPIPSVTWLSCPCEPHLLPDLPFLASATVAADDDSADPAPLLEELDIWPQLTKKESQRLHAIRYLRSWVASKDTPFDPDWLHPVLKDLGRHVSLDDNDTTLWKMVGDSRLEVLDSPNHLCQALLACHEGLGHRQLPSAYKHFSARYWVPATPNFLNVIF